MATDYNQLLANPELAAFASQRKLAEMLLKQGSQTPQGQMIGNIYVGASPWQMLGNLAQQYSGQLNIEDVDKKELAMAKALREKEMSDLVKFSELQYGGKQIPAQAQAGPMPDGGNIPIGTTLSEPDPMAAFQLGAQSTNPLVRSQLAEMLKGQKLGEGEVYQRYNPATGKVETVGQGAAKYRAPIQIDTGTAIELRDPLDPTKVISRIGKSQMPTAGQVVEREDGTYLIDTRTGQAKPIMGANGQPLTGKPKTLPEGLNKQVTGSINLSDAITDYQSKVKNFSAVDFANPDKRAEMGNAYNNMMLQAKEAYNLGVLNGPDYDILQKVVRDPTNPSSLLFTNKALDKQAENLRSTTQSIVKNAYMSQGREVPAEIAKKLVKPEVPNGKNFSSEQDVEKAIQSGSLKKGDKVTVNGVTGTIQ